MNVVSYWLIYLGYGMERLNDLRPLLTCDSKGAGYSLRKDIHLLPGHSFSFQSADEARNICIMDSSVDM